MNPEFDHLVNEVINNIQLKLTKTLKDRKSKYFSFNINCETLLDYQNVDIRHSDQFGETFKRLKELNGPVLYWFEICSETKNKDIIERIKSYSLTPSAKRTPTIRGSYNESSKYLYVGKVKRNFWGRVIHHLGFYLKPGTQGLQIYHWSKGLDLQLKVHAINFDMGMAELVSIIEFEFAKRLDPILGTYK